MNVSVLDILSGSDIIFSPSLLQLPSYYTFQVWNFTDMTSAISEGKFCNESASCLTTISVSTKEARLACIWYVTCHDSQHSLCQLDPGGCETLFMYRVQIPTFHYYICEIYFQEYFADLVRVGKIILSEFGVK
jgi:hypothetical protein